jgi:hypothetical protein
MMCFFKVYLIIWTKTRLLSQSVLGTKLMGSLRRFHHDFFLPDQWVKGMPREYETCTVALMALNFLSYGSPCYQSWSFYHICLQGAVDTRKRLNCFNKLYPCLKIIHIFAAWMLSAWNYTHYGVLEEMWYVQRVFAKCRICINIC